MVFRRIAAPLVIGLLTIVVAGFLTPTILLLGLVVPVVFNIFGNGLWIIPMVFLQVIVFKDLMLTILLSTTIIVYMLEELFITGRYSSRMFFKYSDLYILFGCIGVSLTVFLYTLMLVGSLRYVGSGLLAVIASIYTTREGITLVYLVLLAMAAGLLEKIVTPWRPVSFREGVVSRTMLKIARYVRDTRVFSSHTTLFILLVLTIYYGLPGLPGLALSYIGYRVTGGRKYCCLVTASIYLLYLLATGLVEELPGFSEWLSTVARNIDESLIHR